MYRHVILFNALITFSLVSEIKCEYAFRVIVEPLWPMYLLTICNGIFWTATNFNSIPQSMTGKLRDLIQHSDYLIEQNRWA